jgi:hypothetical protein
MKGKNSTRKQNLIRVKEYAKKHDNLDKQLYR